MIRHPALILVVHGVLLWWVGFARSGPVFTIDFETEDDFSTPLVHGQSISSFVRPNHANPFVPFLADTSLEFGNLMTVSSTVIGNDGHLGPAIYDSDPADTPLDGDDDLRVGLGNILLLQSDGRPETTLHPNFGLVFDDPNDDRSHQDRGSIVIDFLRSNVHPMSIDLIDVNGGVHMDVILSDWSGKQRRYDVPTKWTTDVTVAPSGYQTLDLQSMMNQPAEPNATGGAALASEDAGFNEMQVVRLEVKILGSSPSGGIDNLVFAIPEPSALALALVAASAAAVVRRRGWLSDSRRCRAAA